MTQPTFSTDKFIEQMESWDSQDSTHECFPNSDECPFDVGNKVNMVCTQCPFSEANRKQFINTLKTIKLLELDHVDVSQTTEATKGRK